jgi:hypothetical protein
LSVLVQTFILPGKSVSVSRIYIRVAVSSVDASHS